MKKYLLILIPFFCFINSHAQDFSNKGKDFWVGYGYHQIMTNGNSEKMVLYFATDQVTNITVSVPGIGYSMTYPNIPANTVFTSNEIPNGEPLFTIANDASLQEESTAPENKGIHIVADKPIVAYAHIYNQNVSGASILFPTNTLGKEYYSINYDNVSNSPNANCWFYAIATDTGATTIEITPSANTINHPAGIPFTVNLTQGQVYNVMGELTGGGGGGVNTGVDLTGSKIKSISSGSGGCKKIAVFSGSGRIAISCNGTAPSSDNYMVQAFPKAAWGKKFLTVHTSVLTNNIYRICVSDPTTAVTVNGAPIAVPLQNNFYYELAPTAAQLKIESDYPVTVAQYITSQSACGNTGGGSAGDPEVIYLSPVEQNIAKVLWNATPNNAITQHYYNVVIPNTGTAISSFKRDGVAVNPALFVVHPQDPGFSYLIQAVTQGQHVIESDSGFNAIAYGYGNFESYGYNAGTNIKDLYNRLEPINPLSISPDPVACTGTPFYFSVTFPFQPTSLIWNFHNSPFLQPNANTVTTPDPSLILESTYFIGARQVWRYKLPSLYWYIPANSNPGYPVTITAGTTNAEGCGNSYERDFDLAVYDPPVANYTWTNNGCITDSVRFTDATVYVAGTYSYKWYWNFGDGTTDSVRNPRHLFATPGTYNVKFAMISNVGCLSDTSNQVVVISPLPTASVAGTTAVCQNSPAPNVTFNGILGTPPFTFTYHINSGPDLTATTNSNTATVPAPTSTVGSFVYTITGVQGQNCFQASAAAPITVTVNPLPTATISGTTAVCRNAPSPNITFTAANSTAPYKFTYKINGGPNLFVTTTVGNSVTVAVPTGTAGTFIYSLVSVQDASTTACVQAQAGTATVTVNPLPTATISGTTSVCLNAPAPNVTFTGAGGTAPYKFTYTINGGPNLLATTTSGNSVTVIAPTSTAGTFTYALLSVQESGGTTCSQAQAGNAVVTIFPLPIADFTSSNPSCENKTINFTDASVPNVGSLNEWHWDFGDLSPIVNTQNPTHTFAAAGTYQVKLYVKTTNGCQSPLLTKNVIVNSKPLAGFIDPEVCLSDIFAPFTDTSTVAGGTIATWQWNFGDPGSGALNTSNLQNPTHTYSVTGIKNTTLIVTSNFGCKDTVLQSFYINGTIPLAGLTVQNENALCANDSVAIQGSSTVDLGNIVKVEIYWDNLGAPGVFETDDVPTPGKVYTHLYPNFQAPPLTKNYQIRFRAYSGISCVNDKFKDIVINSAPKVVFNAIPDTCLYVSPFQLTEASETSGIAGTFVYTGPGTSATGLFDPSSVGPGEYTIHYTFTANTGCMDSGQRTIRVLAPPTANFGFTRPGCQAQNISFSDSSNATAGTITTWTWDFGDGSGPLVRNTGATFTHQFAASGTYDVTLMVTTGYGCNSLVKHIPVLISPLPVVDFSFTDTACLPNALIQFNNLSSISDNSENSFIYTWTFGDGSPVDHSVNPSHIYNNVGPYIVKLAVQSNAQCISTNIKVLNTIHPRPDADFNFNKASVCVGNNVGLLDLSDPKDGSVTQWYWNFGDSQTSAEQAPVYTYNSAGTYVVNHSIVNSFGCASDTTPKPFTVYAYPVVNAGEDKLVLEGETVVLDATATGNDLQFSWTRDGNVTTDLRLNNSTILNPVCTPIEETNYTLTVTGKGGCPSTDQVKVKVLKIPRIPNTFSPNADGTNDRWNIEYLKSYPAAKVQVFTRTGQLVFESKGVYQPWDGTIKGKALPIDTYYYIIEPESGRKPVTGYVTILK
ncbi:MAG: PKD domain-containing protein [Ferruginibacter sp.]